MLIAAATLMGAIMAAATLVALERQTRALLLSEAERTRLRPHGGGARPRRGGAASGSEALLQASELAKEERERALETLRAARIEAERANLAKDEFLAVLSHELRTPLHAVLGWLSILKKGLAAGRNVDRAMETLERNVQLQARLVNDLLDVSRIVFDKLGIEHEPVDLAMVVRGAVEDARPVAEAKGVALLLSMAPPSNAVIGDEKRLRQMVGNLLNNAVKFTPSGGRVTVTLEAHEDDEAVVSIADTGDGISPELLPHVFDRFHLADATRTRQHGGLGLGLTIVKNLTRLHGGRVEATSEGTRKGARFSLHLPLGPALSDAPAPSSDVHPVSSSTPVLGDLAGVTALLVEDDPDGREALRLALEQAGAQVHACASPADARSALERIVPDIVLSDIGMPGESGHAFLRWVRARGDTTPAVAVSGFASREDREEALASGFDAHASKPIDTDALVLTLRHARPQGRPLRPRVERPLTSRRERVGSALPAPTGPGVIRCTCRCRCSCRTCRCSSRCPGSRRPPTRRRTGRRRCRRRCRRASCSSRRRWCTRPRRSAQPQAPSTHWLAQQSLSTRSSRRRWPRQTPRRSCCRTCRTTRRSSRCPRRSRRRPRRRSCRRRCRQRRCRRPPRCSSRRRTRTRRRRRRTRRPRSWCSCPSNNRSRWCTCRRPASPTRRRRCCRTSRRCRRCSSRRRPGTTRRCRRRAARRYCRGCR